MKKLFIGLFTLVMISQAPAQFTGARLQAIGLTCAMCSNAINKSLKTKAFIASVNPDIKNSSFDIVFKESVEVDIDEIRKAVEDAGFSVGRLALTGKFSGVKIENDKHVQIGDRLFHFLNVSSQVLDGERTIIIVDRNFLTDKQFKKYGAATKMKCVQTGRAGDCCPGVAGGTRTYHVTI
jgi:copper chaperone CopZ